MPKKPQHKSVPLHRSAAAKSWAMFKANPFTVGGTLFGIFIGLPSAVVAWDTYIYPITPAFHIQIDGQISKLEQRLKRLEGNIKLSSGDDVVTAPKP